MYTVHENFDIKIKTMAVRQGRTGNTMLHFAEKSFLLTVSRWKNVPQWFNRIYSTFGEWCFRGVFTIKLFLQEKSRFDRMAQNQTRLDARGRTKLYTIYLFSLLKYVCNRIIRRRNQFLVVSSFSQGKMSSKKEEKQAKKHYCETFKEWKKWNHFIGKQIFSPNNR